MWFIAWLQRLKLKKTYIGQHEITALLAPYLTLGNTLPLWLKGRRVVHFVDNESAIAASIKGYSGQLDSSRLYQLVRMRLQCNVWLYYVPSESNISDWPSRGRLRDVVAIGARAISMRIPRLSDLMRPWAEVYRDLDMLV